MNHSAYLKCIKCGSTFPLGKEPLTCPKHSQYYGYLGIFYDYESIPGFIEFDTHPWEKYLPLLPISKFKFHLNEKKTPLIEAKNLSQKLGIGSIFIKDEGKNPTGSFKDRESLVCLNAGIEFGIKDIEVVSSGNAAVSTAAYAQKAKLNCTCIVPKSISVGKRFLIGLYAGQMKFKDGIYEDLYREAIDVKSLAWNVTPGLNPYKEEGVKLIGFEIWEDMGVPDGIVVPCGNGTLLFSIFKAFWELKKLGKIDHLPIVIGVQVKNAAPLLSSYLEQKDWIALKDIPDSIAEGIVAAESYASPKVMWALHETGGSIIEVEETEIKEALKEVISLESLIPEPTSAAAFAGIKKLPPQKFKTIVVIQTASGMKNLKEIMESYLV